MNDLYPYVLQPKLSPAIWGGDALVATYHKDAPASEKLGESWECWDEDSVRNGALAGKTVAQLRALLGHRLVGSADPARIFPILTKIIDAHASLSVQVHPDDAYAQRVEHQPNGKTECWYILAAAPGAELVLGWTRDTDRAEYERRVADGSLADILRRVPVHAGDAFYLPAGTLHAIGSGVQIFETQQASDLTYRIFDWNRVGPDGKPRELHVQKAADVLDYHRGTRGAISPLTYESEGMARTLYIGSSRFTVERVTAQAQGGTIASDGSPLIVMSLGGTLSLTTGSDEVPLAPWTTALVPAAIDRVTFSASAEAIVVAIPQSIAALQQRLSAAGVTAAALETFFADFS